MIIEDGNEGGEENAGTFEEFEAKVASGDEGTDGQADEPEENEEDGEEAADPNVNDEADENEEDSEEEQPKKKGRSLIERNKWLTRRLREAEQAREADRKGFEARLEKIEKSGLTSQEEGGTSENERVAPDPNDLEKYPLGSLDDRYIQDAIEFKAEQAATKMVDSLLQRQEQSAAQAEAEKLLTDLRSKADNVAAKGSEIHDDYQEVVVDAGLRGDYDLTQTTFEAAAEAEHGAEILYGLASDPAEASRVAKLSPFQQLRYVAEKDAEFAKGKPAAKIPGAPPPPANTPKGGRSRQTISPATENFEEFERLANAKQ